MSKALSTQRFQVIDALRGIACGGVFFHHLLHCTVLEKALSPVFPAWLKFVNAHGVLGVQIFFVLSGFVITHSLRDNPLNKDSIFNFALRRQLRLDPPYWFTIAVVLLLQWIQLQVPQLATPPMPSIGVILANLFYLQDLVHVPPIQYVGWTLCLEVQFYIFLIVLLGAAKHLGNLVAGKRWDVALMWLTGAISLGLGHVPGHTIWFGLYWFYFASGALTYWVVNGVTRPWVLFSFLTTIALNIPISLHLGNKGSSVGPAALCASIVCTMLIRHGISNARMARFWQNGLLQYMGRISYSLYLVHLPVLILILRAGYKVTGNNHLMAVGWFFLAAAVSVGLAHLLYKFVERPSVLWAARLKKAQAV